MTFPELPTRAEPWRAAVVIARGQLLNMYLSTSRIIETGNFNRYRIIAHQNVLHQQVPQLIQSIQLQEPDLAQWVSRVCQIFLDIDNELDRILLSDLGDSESSTSNAVRPYATVYTSRPGRPSKQIDPKALQWAAESSMSTTAIASLFGVSLSVLRKQLKAAGLPTSNRSNIDDDQLQELVRDAMASRPDTGFAYLTAIFAPTFRQQTVAKKQRGSYHISRPHALWHIDGHHKLIKFGIVIHGIIDGYSRKITGLRASTSNSAATVADLFMDAIIAHGVPSRVRGDRGGENRDVSIAMIKLRGKNRGSFMWGPSTRNTPIERNWVELGRRVCRAWRVFFQRLGRLHNLDQSNTGHLWLLQYLFLDVINEDCRNYVEEWNAHPMRNRKNMCPNDLEIEGMMKYGIYDQMQNLFSFEDECEGLNDQEREEYYQYPKTGACSGDEMDSDGDEVKMNDSSDQDFDLESDRGDHDPDDDEHKRKSIRSPSPVPADRTSSDIEIVPPPTSQPAPKKRRYQGPINHPSSLCDLFPGHSSVSTSTSAITSTSTSSSSGSGSNSNKGKAKALTQAAPARSNPFLAKSKGKGKAKVEPKSGVMPDAKLGTIKFKEFMAGCIQSDNGDARAETNNQGGKGPSSSMRRASAASSQKTSTSLSMPPRVRIANSNEFRTSPSGQPLWPFLINHSKCFMRDRLPELTQDGFAYRNREVTFCEHWSEKRVFEEFRTHLPEACEQLLDAYNSEEHGDRAWYPCHKKTNGSVLVVTRVRGPYDGARMREIAGMINKSRVQEGIYIASPARLIEDDEFMIQHSSDSDFEPPATRKSHTRSKAKLPVVSSSKLPATKSRSTGSDFSDNEYEIAEIAALTERELTPDIAIEGSFSGISISGPRRASPSELPEEAAYRPSSPDLSLD
ncbi:hypothetical protein CVT24_007511 [Panaeolus cyanescens]|uniref:Integrase catalytic domain-containing protein n=1 Tax=Panaeolus cyanescens TaxID=181874 RepID=A0A409YL64_9AGAR|nr:hypothetical protein CVT24_007511 [Panaeolus cyanescens]